MRKVLSIEYYPKQRLGRGGFGSVFSGIYKGQPVAVKRVESIDTDDEREENALKKLKHQNVVELYHVECDEEFK
jgi:serine/threonine-protein kinase/endoribonuclease IRE1